MCTIVEIDGKEIESIGELKKIFPKLIGDKIYGNVTPEDRMCLCPIDIEKTAEAYDRKAIKAPFGYKIL